MDTDAYYLAKAVRQQETGGSKDPYNQKGASGEFGAYQFMPATYKNYAQKYLGNAAAPPSVENQNKIAYSFIKEKKDAGFTPAQIASMWNAGEGEPDAYKGVFKTGRPSKGKNDHGVYYDVPGYAAGVSKYYKELKGAGQGNTAYAASEPPPTPQPLANQSGAWFPSSPSDSPITAGLKTLGNVPHSLFDFAKNTISTLNPISTLGRLFGDIPHAFSDLKQQQGGSAGGAIGAALKEVPGAVAEGFIPKGVRDVGAGVAGAVTGNRIGNTDRFGSAQEQFTNDPVGNVAPLLLAGRTGAQRLGVGEAFDSGISRVAQTATAPIRGPIRALGSAVGGVAKFGAAQATGLKPDTLGTIAENPRAFTKENMGEIDRKSVADEIKGALDQRIAALDETGSGYEPIRSAKVVDESVAEGTTKRLKFQNSSAVYDLVDVPNEFLSLPELRAKAKLLSENVRPGTEKKLGDVNAEIAKKAETDKVPATVKVDPNWLERAIRETTGLGVRNGRIVAKTTSSIREARDVSALQKTYDLWRPAFAKGRITNKEFLNFRRDMARLAGLDREVSRSAPLENLSGIIRGKLNTAYRGKVPGLEKLDKDFEAQASELRSLRKGLIDKEGNLTPQAISRVANAVNRGKDLELAKLEKIVPGITKKIRIVKAIEDIEDAKGQKVGTYIRGGLMVGGALTLNLPAIIAAVISTPELAIPILRQYGYAKPLVDQVLKALKTTAGGQGDFGKLLDKPVSMPRIPQFLRPR